MGYNLTQLTDSRGQPTPGVKILTYPVSPGGSFLPADPSNNTYAQDMGCGSSAQLHFESVQAYSVNFP
jgi:hypothetical protein